MNKIRVQEVMEIRDLNLRIRKQLSVIVTNTLGIRSWTIQTESLAPLVLQFWFKLVILIVKHIYHVFHPTSAQMHGFLTLVALTTWNHTKNGSLRSSQAMILFVYLGDDESCTITWKRQNKVFVDDDSVQTLNDVIYISVQFIYRWDDNN